MRNNKQYVDTLIPQRLYTLLTQEELAAININVNEGLDIPLQEPFNQKGDKCYSQRSKCPRSRATDHHRP